MTNHFCVLVLLTMILTENKYYMVQQTKLSMINDDQQIRKKVSDVNGL